MRQLTKHEIIDETVKYYSDDVSRRSLDITFGCRYWFKSKMCAVGRCMKNPEEYESFDDTISTLISNLELKNPQELFKQKYQGHTIQFWEDIQTLHDDSDNWNKGGLTGEGREYVKKLKKEWN